MNDLNEGVVTALQMVAVLGVAVTVGLIAWLLVTGLIKAGNLRPNVALVIALSILTLVSVIGFIITQSQGQQSTELITVAATGMGALAGAVANTWGDRDNPVPVATGFQNLPPAYTPVGVEEAPVELPEDLSPEEPFEEELEPSQQEQDELDGVEPTLEDDLNVEADEPVVEERA